MPNNLKVVMMVSLPDNGRYRSTGAGLEQESTHYFTDVNHDPTRAALSRALTKLSSGYLYREYLKRMERGDSSVKVTEMGRYVRNEYGGWTSANSQGGQASVDLSDHGPVEAGKPEVADLKQGRLFDL